MRQPLARGHVRHLGALPALSFGVSVAASSPRRGPYSVHRQPASSPGVGGVAQSPSLLIRASSVWGTVTMQQPTEPFHQNERRCYLSPPPQTIPGDLGALC